MSLRSKLIEGNEVNNALYKAIFSGNNEKVDEIIESYGFSYISSWMDGFDLLVTAMELNRIELAKLMIKKGCRCESRDVYNPALFSAVSCGDVELITMMLDKNVNIMTKTPIKGESVLHLAIGKGYEDVARLLISRGMDIEVRNIEGITPLHLSAIRNNTGMIELLLLKGANIESKDDCGKTSLFHAVSGGNKDTVRVLLARGANANCTSDNGQLPLHDSVVKSNEEIVKCLLDAGADINANNMFGQTALHIACMIKSPSLTLTLLNAGADVNVIDLMGMSPCDCIKKKMSSGIFVFDDSRISYNLGKYLIMLKVGGFYLNKKNEAFYSAFYDTYCTELPQDMGTRNFNHNLQHINTFLRSCQDEISKMKMMKSRSGFTVHSIFKKLKNPFSVISENEINFISATKPGEADKPYPVEEHVTKFGYPFESHEIQTEDGYQLTLHRIPYGKGQLPPDTLGPPVLLQHGILSVSAAWVTMENSLGFVLADAGYDVWLANWRGNTYSRGHVKYNFYKDSAYYDYSFHEKGYYDLPASINYILQKTGRSQLVFVGHSLGCTTYLVMGAMRPEYMSKVKAAFLLAPVAYPKHTKSPAANFIKNNLSVIKVISESLGERQFLAHTPQLVLSICKQEEFQNLCKELLFSVEGYDEKQLTKDTLSEISQYFVAGSSFKELEHLRQIALKNAYFSQFNYGMEKNLKKYHSVKPPKYNLKNVNAPTFVYYAINDWLSDPEDVEYLAKCLPSVQELVKLPYTEFNHIDFLWATDAKTFLYDDMLARIKALPY